MLAGSQVLAKGRAKSVRLAFVEDEPLHAQTLMDLLGRSFFSGKFEAVSYASPQAMLDYVEKGLVPRIVLMDIEFPEGVDEGILAVRKLHAMSPKSQVIYVTGYDSHHSEVYRTERVWFLTKPVSPDRLDEALGKVFYRLVGRADDRVVIGAGASAVVLDIDDIVYAAIEDRKIRVYTVKGTRLCSDKLDSLEDRLPPGFTRCHKSYLVNLDYVERIESGSLYLRNGETIPTKQRC